MTTTPLPTTGADLASEVRAAIGDLYGPADAREAFVALGRRGLFAPHYPARLGGRDGSLTDYLLVAGALGERDLADVAHLVTVQGVGCALLEFCTETQRLALLPRLAAGELLASLLLSERHAGTDASAIRTTAARTESGWSLTGTKSWSLHTDWSGIGLCSARTGEAGSRYAGITVFLVDLRKPGVRLEAVARAAGPPYFDVHLDGVALDDADVVGEVGEGWRVLTAAAAYERSGIDYLSRGELWLGWARAAAGLLPQSDRDDGEAGLARLDQDLRGARQLVWRTALTADGFAFDEGHSAYSKYAAGTAAQDVAAFIARRLLPHPQVRADAHLVDALRRAVAEGPELSISGNNVDLLLDAISLDPWMGEA